MKTSFNIKQQALNIKDQYMEAPVKSSVLLYTEQTPNPEALKYVTNRMLYRGIAEFRDVDTAAQ